MNTRTSENPTTRGDTHDETAKDHDGPPEAIDGLPDEILAHVFALLPCLCLSLAARLVCRRWHAVATDAAAVGRPLCCTAPRAHYLSQRQDGVLVRAAIFGHIDCMRYARERGHPWTPAVPQVAAKGGHLSCLQYAADGGCPVSPPLTALAAESGNLACVRFAHQWTRKWDSTTCANAVIFGVDFLHKVRALGCPWGKGTCWLVCNSYETIRDDKLMAAALAYLVEHKCPPCRDLCHVAIAAGRFDLVIAARAMGARWNEDDCFWAADAGRLDWLRYLHEHGCPWDNGTTTRAAWRGHFDCLRYAHQHGCPLERIGYEWAVGAGHMRCARYMLDHGCAGDPALLDAVRSIVPHDEDTPSISGN
ncbi:Ankyrin repeat domain containing protein [Pandoravirus salinus]|uniref:Ankyrin repeat domain containing protein n=1 Tax=Pandoravirus salinus TaxID=1349410 RepID=S4VWS7_9VIRU|nr:ankyrin repeat domain [Pandoravirus salinus]AGO85109.1 Ankyrin repeat domain containing protein [Pandoravirus salinus]